MCDGEGKGGGGYVLIRLMELCYRRGFTAGFDVCLRLDLILSYHFAIESISHQQFLC